MPEGHLGYLLRGQSLKYHEASLARPSRLATGFHTGRRTVQHEGHRVPWPQPQPFRKPTLCPLYTRGHEHLHVST